MVEMKEIYRTIYESHPDYGTVNHGGPMQEYVLGEKPSSLLDIGCGDGRFLSYLLSRGIHVAGIDIWPPVKAKHIIQADARDLPFADGQFEIVTAFDVLEHFSEPDIDVVLAEAERVARTKIILSICYRDSVFLCFGESLHRTVRPHEWWFDRLSEYGKVELHGIYETYGFYVVVI